MDDLPEPARRIHEAIIRLAEKPDALVPTYREIADELGMSVGGVQRQVRALIERDYLKAAGSKTRNLRILKNPDGSPYAPQRQHRHESPVRIRIEGEIAAGPSVEPTDGPSLVELPGLAGTPPGHFWLRVKGSSMSRAGILPGSLVYCRRQSDVGPGEIAVCMLEDETVTLKCVVADRKNGRVKLVPKCDGLEPVAYRSVEIQARVLYVLRQV